ncbi:MAG: flagellar basal body L-ring protein FlgH, partial [Gammaproteobacteria bacterium]|nr:flagellar basal body L-ring protein FlgH [Gammaproteobacteria bacterium]
MNLHDLSIRAIVILVAAGLLSACGSIIPREESYDPPLPEQQVYEPPSSGSIYRAGTDVRLFEDLKAGRVGDILTVRLTENTNASKNSQTSTSKSTDATLANPTIFGRPTTFDGV